MVAHVTEYPGSLRLTSCDVRGRAEHIQAPARETAVPGRHLRLVVDNDRAVSARQGRPQSQSQGRAQGRAQDRAQGRLIGEQGEAAGPSGLIGRPGGLTGRGGDGVICFAVQRSGLAGGLTIAAGVVALLVVVLLVGVRLSQGGPPEEFTMTGMDQTVEPSVAPGDLVVVAGPGDSLWSLAGEYAAGQDRRAAVAALVEANGGAAIVVGQAIVIPGQLLA